MEGSKYDISAAHRMLAQAPHDTPVRLIHISQISSIINVGIEGIIIYTLCTYLYIQERTCETHFARVHPNLVVFAVKRLRRSYLAYLQFTKYMMNNVVILFMVFDLVFGMDLDSKNELFTLLPKTSRNQSNMLSSTR